MELSIIILSYNTKDLTVDCIRSVAEQYKNELSKSRFEIIVVDNASSDGSLATLRRLRFKGLSVVESKENLGFSKGCNLGAKNAAGKYLLFLNSDTLIKDQGFLKMINFLERNENTGILGAKLKNEDGTNQLSSGKFYSLFNLFLMLFGFNKLVRESPNVVKKVEWVSGASMMIKKSIFQKLGGFDKDIFMYLEDMDFCFRAKEKGLDTYFFPEIMLFHEEGKSSGRTFAVVSIYKSLLIFYKKHKSKFEYQVARNMFRLKAMILVVLGKILDNKYLQTTYSQILEI